MLLLIFLSPPLFPLEDDDAEAVGAEVVVFDSSAFAPEAAAAAAAALTPPPSGEGEGEATAAAAAGAG